MIRIRRRARRKLLLLTVACLFASTILVYLVRLRSQRMLLAQPSSVSALAPGSLRLPFTLPCAIYSGDATPIYAALRNRDRTSLMEMVAKKRVLMVQQGTSVAIVSVSHAAMVTIGGGLREGGTCYIPSDIVPVIQRRIVR